VAKPKRKSKSKPRKKSLSKGLKEYQKRLKAFKAQGMSHKSAMRAAKAKKTAGAPKKKAAPKRKTAKKAAAPKRKTAAKKAPAKKASKGRRLLGSKTYQKGLAEQLAVQREIVAALKDAKRKPAKRKSKATAAAAPAKKKRASAKKASAKKAAPKKSARKASAKKAAPKRASAKKPAAKKASAAKRRAWSRKSLQALVQAELGAKKPRSKKKSAKKASAKKASAKKASAKKASARKASAKKASARKPSAKRASLQRIAQVEAIMGAPARAPSARRLSASRMSARRSGMSGTGAAALAGIPEEMLRNPRRRGRRGFLANFTPAASGIMRYLPTKEVALELAKQAGIGAVGFAGGITAGRLFAGNSFITRTIGARTGPWTSVIGSVLGVGVLYGVGRIPMVNRKLGGFMPWLLGGAALSAVVNALTVLVSRGTIPANIAQWVAPWAPVATAAVASSNGVPAEDVASGFGQIDVYERAMSGMGNAQAALQYEMSKMSGGGSVGNDGIFEGGRNVFGEYQDTYPWTTSAEQGVAAYESTPVGAEVEEAFAAYETAPMGASVMEATAGLGANVMEATAGMGDARAILADIAASTRQIVQRRRAQGLPVDAAFTQKVAQAAANVARTRMASSRAASSSVAKAPAMARMSSAAPGLYGKVVGKAVTGGAGAGVPEAIEGEGIFAGEGILSGEGIFG
jgi:hypothetical protein